MKMNLETRPGVNAVTSYGVGYVEINHERYDTAIVVSPTGPVERVEIANFDALAAAHFEALLAAEPEVVLLGTGERHRFVHPRLLASLAARRIGVETMSTGAACRTYNLLMIEDRRVVALLLHD